MSQWRHASAFTKIRLVRTISPIICSRLGTLGINITTQEGCKLTKTSEAEAPERKGNRSRNREEPFCVADVVDGFTSGDANNGDSCDRKSDGCCGSCLNLFSSGAASSVLVVTAKGGGEDATTPSPPPDADDFLCNLGESPLDTVIFAFPSSHCRGSIAL